MPFQPGLTHPDHSDVRRALTRGEMKDPYSTAVLKLLGSDIKGQSFSIEDCDNGMTVQDGTSFGGLITLHESVTLTGICFIQGTNGVLTADNNTKVALYKLHGRGNNNNIARRVAQSSNNAALFTGGANRFVKEPFTGTYAATPGRYFALVLANWSAVTTSPTVVGHTSLTSSILVSTVTNVPILTSFAGADLLATLALTSTTTSVGWVGVY